MLAVKTILVPTDFSVPADVALMYGRELAGQFGATLHVLHVVDNIQVTAFPEAYGEMAATLEAELEAAARDEIARRLIDNDGSGPRTAAAVVTSMAPVTTIVDYARINRVDLIVMGTHGRGAFAHFMIGSVAERVVRAAPCPVLTVRHPEHEFVRPDTLTTVAHA
jgi:nucleotide-binding universal stress UspA family protein